MKKVIFLLLLCTFNFFGQENSQESSEIIFHGKDFFRLEGTIIADSLKENRYDRLPASYKDIVREQVWELSKSSTGLSIRFITNSSIIKVKWEILNDLKMDHMPETGIKGVDLYFRNNDNWQYLNTGRPKGKLNEYTLVENMTAEEREYKVYLPLYDGVKNIEIGIDSSSFMIVPDRNFEKPIIFYGTSIPTSIMVFKKSRNTKDILFIDASEHFEKVKTQNVLTEEHIDKIISTYSNRNTEDKYSYLASPEELIENEYNLNIPRYVDTFEEEEPIDLEAVSNELKSLENEITETNKTISDFCNELNIKAPF